MFDASDEAQRERDNLKEVVDEDTGEMVVVSNQMYKGHKQRGITKRYYNEFDETGMADFLLEVVKIGMSVKSRNAEDMKEGLMKYLHLCQQQHRRITNMACYTAMGINKAIAYDMDHGRSGTPEQKKLIQFVKGLCATYREGMMVSNDLNPIVGIFWQKSFDGLNELDEVNAVAMELNESHAEEDAESIADKYDSLPD
jgi:hypothetical protein